MRNNLLGFGYNSIAGNNFVFLAREFFKHFNRVVKNGEILGKPRDEAHAKEMLKKLSGSEHEVVTGYAVLTSGKKIISHDITKVIFNELNEDFITDYVNGGSPMDKAGAYGIQDGGLAKSIVGEYDNVVGLPTKKILKAITEIYET